MHIASALVCQPCWISCIGEPAGMSYQ